MKRLLPLLLLVLACASSDDGYVDSEMIDCAEMGNAVSVQLVDAQFGSMQMGVRDFSVPVEFKLEVSNNTDHHIIVRQIGISGGDASSPFRIDAGWNKVNEMIDEGAEHVFTVQALGRQTREIRRGESTSMEVRTSVTLENGEIYRCGFGVPLPTLPPSR